MEIFTYRDYLKYEKLKSVQLLKYEDMNTVREPDETYSIEYNTVNNQHDKIFRKILDDKREAVKFLNKTLKLPDEIKEEQIEKYNSSFVKSNLVNQEADIIYKLKDKNIFFLIEHQTKIDYKMPLRILEYVTAIIKSAINNRKIISKEYKFPQVIPIVLYTGKKEWNVKKYIVEVQEVLKGYEGAEFTKYNVVDINKFSEEELLKEETFISKAMLIEKTRDTEDLSESLNKIIKEITEKPEVYNEEQKELLITIIDLVLRRKLKEDESKEMIRRLREVKNMLAVLEMIEEENKKLIAKGERIGKKKGIKMAKLEDARRMLEKGFEIEIIIEITELTKEEILKKE